jgi:AraC-like DNA-binding protein
MMRDRGGPVLKDCALQSPGSSFVVATRAAPGIETMRAMFFGHAFSSHRHDTYAIGVTALGVQTFRYRGETRRSTGGRAFVLHPDEAHDGRAGDERGFGYAIAYIEPSLILAASDGRGLPFVRTPVVDDTRFVQTVEAILSGADDLSDDVAATCAIAALTDALWRVAGSSVPSEVRLRLASLHAVRDALLAANGERVSVAELERIANLSRWELARQFRRAFGVSPYRFHVMRRLEHARRRIAAGARLADAALECGFADQSHFTRHFRGAYGMSPGRWRCLANGMKPAVQSAASWSRTAPPTRARSAM